MKRVTIEKVVKTFMVGFGLMFAYGIITFIVLIAKHGLHIGYVSDGSIEFVLAMLGITLFVGVIVSSDTKGKDKNTISGYEWDDDDWDDPINDPAYSDCICNNYYTGD